MHQNTNIVLDHTPTNIKVDSFGEWLDYVLIAAEEHGREQKYFDQDSPYWATYHRDLTPRQRWLRKTMSEL